jgi:hypothetical protein
MKKLFLLPLVACSALSLNTFAKAPDWTYLQASYALMNNDEVDELEFKGFSVAGSGKIGDDFFIAGRYTTVEDKDYNQELDQLSFGGGTRYAVNETTDFYAAVFMERAEFDYGLDDGVDTGYSAKLGLRTIFADNFDVNVAVGKIDVVSSETLLELDAFYLFETNENLSTGFSYRTFGDFDSYEITMRYSF